MVKWCKRQPGVTGSQKGQEQMSDHRDPNKTGGTSPPTKSPSTSTTPSPEIPRLLTVKAAAAYLSCSLWAVRSLAWEQRVPYLTIGRRMLFDRADLDTFIESAKTKVVL